MPGIYADVTRADAHRRCDALDRNGRPFDLEADGLLAVCIQHEMDHLDGKLFVDYLSPAEARDGPQEAGQAARWRDAACEPPVVGSGRWSRLTLAPRPTSMARTSIMRIIFAGTPEFAVPCLRAAAERDEVRGRLHAAGPSGRARSWAAAVAGEALKRCSAASRCSSPKHFERRVEQDVLRALQPDLMVVVAYGLILPQQGARHPALRLLERACLAAAALAWRGADPARDRGRRRRNRRLPDADGRRAGHRPGAAERNPRRSAPKKPAASCTTAWPNSARESCGDGLGLLRAGVQSRAAPAARGGRDLCAQTGKDRSASRLVASPPSCWRARSAPSSRGRWPKPWLAGERVRIHGAVAIDLNHHAVPGTVLAASRQGIDIACAQGALRLRVVQRDGGKAITAADYLNARRDLVLA